jgi:3-methyladenine DNA glycosylase AlkD
MSPQLKAIKALLKENATPEGKTAAESFVPTKEKIYGVRMPVINTMAKHFKIGGFELAEELWQEESLEEKVLAAKILGSIAKTIPEKALKLVSKFSKGINNWAVCDTIGMQSLKQIVPTHKKEIFALAKKFNSSQNLWTRRLSLVLVEWYTRFEKDHAAIMELVKPLENDKEYYVRKAVVWIKKNFSKAK